MNKSFTLNITVEYKRCKAAHSRRGFVNCHSKISYCVSRWEYWQLRIWPGEYEL